MHWVSGLRVTNWSIHHFLTSLGYPDSYRCSWREDQFALPALGQDQEMVHHRHALFGGRGREPCFVRPEQRRRDQLQFHHGQAFAQTGARSLGERHEEFLHFTRHHVRRHPTCWVEVVGTGKSRRISLSGVALHRDDRLLTFSVSAHEGSPE